MFALGLSPNRKRGRNIHVVSMNLMFEAWPKLLRFNLDMSCTLSYVLNLFPGPCSEEHLPKWSALCSVLGFYAVRNELKQRIEESEAHHQNKRIQSVLSAPASVSIRKI